MLVMAAESYPGAGLSHGRIDQYLYPSYYKADLDSGCLDRRGARELLECFWVKHNYAYDYQGRIGANQGINSGFGQLVTLGGIGPDGKDASNDLTWLILEVIERMNLLEPKPNIRLHAATPDALLDRVVEMVARAQGAPFLLNFDENAMEGLRWQGLPEGRLWDYAPVGCLENTLQGDDRAGTVDVNVNLAKAVELALWNGVSAVAGRRVGPATGRAETFDTYEKFRTAVERQLLAMLDRLLRCAEDADRIRATWEPTPYLSTLVGGCVEKRRDVTAGGARWSYITVEGVGLATLADSVAAVKKLVYEEGRVKMGELLAALSRDFDGCEPLRRTLLTRAPKFGNDDPYVDGIARDLSRLCLRGAGTVRLVALGPAGRIPSASLLVAHMRAAAIARAAGSRGGGLIPLTVAEKFRRLKAVKAVAWATTGPSGPVVHVLPAAGVGVAGRHTLVVADGQVAAAVPDRSRVAVAVITLDPVAYQVKGDARRQGDTLYVEVTHVYTATPPVPGRLCAAAVGGGE